MSTIKKGYLIPHPPLLVAGVGKGSEVSNTKNAIQKIAAEIAALNPETIVMITPHGTSYSDYIHISPGTRAEGNMVKFGAAHVTFSVNYDNELAELIGEIATDEGLRAGPLGERDRSLDHGVTVPLHFINAKRIVRISIAGQSPLDHYRIGMCIAKAGAQLNRRLVIIASGDMSHKLKKDGPYGFATEGPEFDHIVRACVEKNQWQRLVQINPDLAEAAAECGHKSLVMLLGAFDGQKIEGQVLCYEGPFGVGYLTASFESINPAQSLLQSLLNSRDEILRQTRAQEDEYVTLARKAIEHFVRTGKTLANPKTLPSTRAGVFVSIKKDDNLRGCIGTAGPTTKSVAEEIIQNAISACSRDNRFSPIGKDELDDLVYSVDVLFPAEPIKNKSELDVNRYGVIVRSGRRSGLLLPALTGVNTVDEQIGIALRKAGINPDENYTMGRFEVIRHK